MSAHPPAVKYLIAKAAQDERVTSAAKEEVMENAAKRSATIRPDVWLYRMVVGVLGLVVLVSIVGAILLALNNTPTPEFLIALGSAAVGGLAGLLTPTPKSR